MKIAEYNNVLKKLDTLGSKARKRYKQVISILENSDVCRVDRFKDHQLKGELSHLRELHLDGDCLLVYEKVGDEAHLIDILSHKDLGNLGASQDEIEGIELGYNILFLN